MSIQLKAIIIILLLILIYIYMKVETKIQLEQRLKNDAKRRIEDRINKKNGNTDQTF